MKNSYIISSIPILVYLLNPLFYNIITLVNKKTNISTVENELIFFFFISLVVVPLLFLILFFLAYCINKFIPSFNHKEKSIVVSATIIIAVIISFALNISTF